MQIEKIKAIKHDFYEGCGPTETVTLGFKCGEATYLLGTFYYGPGMNDSTPEEAEKLETLIDHIVKSSNDSVEADREAAEFCSCGAKLDSGTCWACVGFDGPGSSL